MKKARIMIAIIAILGIVGGTLAFNVQKYFTGSCFYVFVTGNKTYCFQGASTTTTSGIALAGFCKTSTTGAYPIFNSTPIKYCTTPATVYLNPAE